jgi:hypothetical protein
MGFLISITIASKGHILFFFYTSEEEVSEDNLSSHSVILLHPFKNFSQIKHQVDKGRKFSSSARKEYFNQCCENLHCFIPGSTVSLQS